MHHRTAMTDTDNMLIGFDFSMNKPAMTILYNGKVNFFIWPIDMSKKQYETYVNNGVHCYPRGLSELSPKKVNDNSKLVFAHTTRSIDLANMIVDEIKNFINEHAGSETNLYIASEGLSFASTGDAALNLASYKGVLLGKLYEAFNERLKRLCTYPPISIKSTAGCATREKSKDKTAMIDAFMEDETYESDFKESLINGKFHTSGKKKNFIKCVDDIVDSYYALMTMIKKETII